MTATLLAPIGLLTVLRADAHGYACAPTPAPGADGEPGVIRQEQWPDSTRSWLVEELVMPPETPQGVLALAVALAVEGAARIVDLRFCDLPRLNSTSVSARRRQRLHRRGGAHRGRHRLGSRTVACRSRFAADMSHLDHPECSGPGPSGTLATAPRLGRTANQPLALTLVTGDVGGLASTQRQPPPDKGGSCAPGQQRPPPPAVSSARSQRCGSRHGHPPTRVAALRRRRHRTSRLTTRGAGRRCPAR